MTHDERLHLLHRLAAGDTSRNREFARFEEPEARRVLRSFRRLQGLLLDLTRPDARAQARWAEDRGALEVSVESAASRYRRVALLAPWEAEHLRRAAPTLGALTASAGTLRGLP